MTQETNDIDLPPELEDTLSSLPKEKAAQIIAEITQVRYDLPLPPPQIMREWEAVVPGSAAQVLAMMQLEQKKRHNMGSLSAAHRFIALIGGLLAYFLLIAAIVYCALHGQPHTALALCGVAAFGVIGNILKSRQ